MKSIIRALLFMSGALLALSGCSAISTVMMDSSDQAAADVQGAEAVVANTSANRYTFYDSMASW